MMQLKATKKNLTRNVGYINSTEKSVYDNMIIWLYDYIWLYDSLYADYIKNWMGPYQRTPKEVAGAITYSGLGVCSVGPVGDFLE